MSWLPNNCEGWSVQNFFVAKIDKRKHSISPHHFFVHWSLYLSSSILPPTSPQSAHIISSCTKEINPKGKEMLITISDASTIHNHTDNCKDYTLTCLWQVPQKLLNLNIEKYPSWQWNNIKAEREYKYFCRMSRMSLSARCNWLNPVFTPSNCDWTALLSIASTLPCQRHSTVHSYLNIRHNCTTLITGHTMILLSA